MILHPGYFLHLHLGSDSSTIVYPYWTMLPSIVATRTRNNKDDVFQRVHQFLRIADCRLQTSISLPTHSIEYSLGSRKAKKVSSRAVRQDIHSRRNPHGCPLITAHHQRTPLSTE
jgi:hypothetical protein